MGGRTTWCAVGAAVVAVACAMAAPAGAGTLTKTDGDFTFEDLDLSANALEAAYCVSSCAEPLFRLRDQNDTLTVGTGTGCTTDLGAPADGQTLPAGTYVFCSSPAGTDWEFRLGAGNDAFSGLSDPTFPVQIPLVVHGGDGGDLLVGGNGNDRLYGDAGDDALHGADGDDQLEGSTGADAMSGNAGARDVVTYAGRDEPVTVALGASGAVQGGALDGGSTTRDTIVDVERAVGGNGDDILSALGTGLPVVFDGGPGNDLLLAGHAGNALVGGLGDDTIRGGDGADGLQGGPGNDSVYGGGGADQVAGDAGNDRIEALDGLVDTVVCGVGVDVARGDGNDARTGCEPATTLTGKPPKKTTARRATFRFVSSNPTGAAFQCKLDRKAWAACSSGKTYSGLARGVHTFRVRARDTDGTVDPTPAVATWRIR